MAAKKRARKKKRAPDPSAPVVKQLLGGERAAHVDNMVYELKFWRALDVEASAPMMGYWQEHKARLMYLHVLWDKLDMHFRNLPPRSGNFPPWHEVEFEAPYTVDALFRTPTSVIQTAMGMCSVHQLWDSRNMWWDASRHGIVALDVVLTVYAYFVGRHLHRRFPDHPGHFCEYGSVPLQHIDHEFFLRRHKRDHALRVEPLPELVLPESTVHVEHQYGDFPGYPVPVCSRSTYEAHFGKRFKQRVSMLYPDEHHQAANPQLFMCERRTQI